MGIIIYSKVGKNGEIGEIDGIPFGKAHGPGYLCINGGRTIPTAVVRQAIKLHRQEEAIIKKHGIDERRRERREAAEAKQREIEARRVKRQQEKLELHKAMLLEKQKAAEVRQQQWLNYRAMKALSVVLPLTPQLYASLVTIGNGDPVAGALQCVRQVLGISEEGTVHQNN